MTETRQVCEALPTREVVQRETQLLRQGVTVPHNHRLGSRAKQKPMPVCRRCTRALEQHHALVQGGMQFSGQGQDLQSVGDFGGLGQRQRGDARLRRTRGHKLCGLADVVAQYLVFGR